MRDWLRVRIDGLFWDKTVSAHRIGRNAAWFVIPDRLGKAACVLSGGAGLDISFEIELAQRLGCRVAVFDPSPTGLETFEKQGRNVAGLDCYKLGLAADTFEENFSFPANPLEGSFTVPRKDGGEAQIKFQCLGPADALKQAGFTALELIKLDIEGFEYGFIEKLLLLGYRPAQIAVEFHHFMPNIPLGTTLRCIWKLRRAGYRIVRKDRFDYLFVHRSAVDG